MIIYCNTSQIKAQDLSAKIGKCDNKTKASKYLQILSLHLDAIMTQVTNHIDPVTVNVPCSEALARINLFNFLTLLNS